MKHFLQIILLSALGFSHHLLAKVVFVSDTGFIVENQVITDASATQVWHALVNDVDKWWPKDHTWWEGTLSISPIAGGCFCENKNNKSASHMTISYVEPKTILRMTGGLGPLQEMGMHGALDWKILPEGNQSKIILTYKATGINPDGFAELAPIVGQVQGIQLNQLAEYLK
jgi:hypothetical protein